MDGRQRAAIWSGILLALIIRDVAAAESPEGVSRRLFAAVFLVRGSVAGGNVGSYGVLVRNGEDTTWTKLTKSNVISFGLGYFENESLRRHYLAAGNGLHRSTDGGKTWRILTSWTTEEILCVVPDPVDSAVIYVGTPLGVFKTGDDGNTWVRMMKGLKKWFIQRIIMDSRDRRTLYAASEDDLYKTTDAGEHWVAMDAGATSPLALMQNPDRPAEFVAGFDDGGIRYTVDDGRTWKASRDLAHASIYALRASTDGKDLYAGGWQTGLWRSENGGATWSHVWSDPACEAVYSIHVDPADPGHLLVGSAGAGVFESHDRGVSWKHAGLSGAQVKQIESYP